jgi:hypothetical protein
MFESVVRHSNAFRGDQPLALDRHLRASKPLVLQGALLLEFSISLIVNPLSIRYLTKGKSRV